MKITLNNKEIEVEKKKTILQICQDNGIKIPTLCYHPNLPAESRCRVCLVEMDSKLVTSCSTYPNDGSFISTNSERVLKARKMNLELLMPNLKNVDLDDDFEVGEIYKEVGMDNNRFQNLKNYHPDLGASVIRDNNKCINCGRCVQVCSRIQAIDAIDFASRAHNEHVTPYSEKKLSEVACIKCGQCIIHCPVGAISERSHISEVEAALADPNKHVVVQTAPSIRAALGELFNMETGTLVTGKMVTALKMLKFDKVFDVDLGADMTIMEEASEFLKRVKEGGPFPMITTCCPGWVLMMEYFYHELIPNMSTCKSPHEMLGSLIKNYYGEKSGIPKEKIIVVSIMPCTAKKFESTRPEMDSDVDYVLTTRELGRLLKKNNIAFETLEDTEFDPTLGISTGAGAIFGAAGGVLEAALRTSYELATAKQLEKVEFEQIRGDKGIKTGSIMINGTEIKFACANGGANIRKLLKEKDKYHLIEMMACPGGCIGGGGQPIFHDPKTIEKRMGALYQEDRNLPFRKSHENPIVKKIYKECLGQPLSKKAHKLLHTTYTKRSKF